MKALSDYAQVPGFYKDEDGDLLVVNDEQEATWISGNPRFAKIVDVSLLVKPVIMQSFLVASGVEEIKP